MLPVKGQPGNNYYQVREWVARKFQAIPWLAALVAAPFLAYPACLAAQGNQKTPAVIRVQPKISGGYFEVNGRQKRTFVD
jgi:hypothetical protein